ncbi:class I adenylate-forming enzyme family protein [Streptomyces antibioticus]|uniref:class I adenylate-forming enzyme family protein n=1 Tax=Streptomyces antibioticus TaxID=1890 RepID=UPI0033AE950F
MIDIQGTTTFAALYAAAARHALEAERTTAADGGVAPLHASSNAAFLSRVCGELMAGRTPLVLPSRIPQNAADEAAEAVRRTRLSCRPWKAMLTVLHGRQVAVVTHGESPGASRKAHALGMARGGRILLAASLHLNGPFEFALRQLLFGGTLVLLPTFSANRWARAIQRERPDWAFLVPTQLRQVWDSAGDAAAMEICAPLRHLVHSSEPCPPELGERLAAALGPRLLEYYGTTLYDGTLTRHDAAGGIPIPGAELRVVDRHGWPVAQGTTGQIEGRSRCGLINHPAGETCHSSHTWQGVGDTGRRLPGGHLQVTGTDVEGRVIVAGVKVSPDDTRRVLLAHPGVTACTVTVRPHDRFGSVLAAVVETVNPELTTPVLRSWCAQRLTSPQRPHALEVRPCLPDPKRESHA